VHRLDSVLVENEDADLAALGERAGVERRQVVATQLDVTQRVRQTARHSSQAALGHVDVRQRRRTVEVQAVQLAERVASQHEVQQLRQVTQSAPLDAVDAIVCQEEITKRGQITERELGECGEVVVPQVKSAHSQFTGVQAHTHGEPNAFLDTSMQPLKMK